MFREADGLAEARAKLLGRRRLPADERAAVDEVYLLWLEKGKLDDLVSAVEGMFSHLGILSYRLEFVTDLAGELEDREDKERIRDLFERTIPGVWRAYLREIRHADKGLLGNIAEAATRKAEMLAMLHDYFEAMHRLGDLRLAERIRAEALRFAREDRFDPKMKLWRTPEDPKAKRPGRT